VICLKNAIKIVFCILIILLLSNSVLAFAAITKKVSIPKTYAKVNKNNEKITSTISPNVLKIKDAVLVKPEEDKEDNTNTIHPSIRESITGSMIEIYPIDEDLLDDAPEIMDITLNPSNPMEGQQFTITVEADDDNAMKIIALWLGTEYNHQGCNATPCTVNFTKMHNTMGTYNYMVRAVDSKDQGHTLMHQIEVREFNNPPVLVSIGNRNIDELQTLSIDVDANDPDVGDTLTYSTDATFGNIDSNTGIFTWTPGVLDAGTYPVRFSVSDSQDSDYEDIIITVNNVPQAPPTITSVSVTPTTAYTNDVLTCVASGWSSSIGAPPAYYYDWEVQGVSTGETTNTFDCSTPGCDKHDTVECFVTPYDTEGQGTALSDSVVIQNTLPTVSPAVLPAPAYTNDDLVCDCSSYTDVDGDSVSCTGYDWFENGILAYEDDPNFYALGTSRGDEYYCTAIPFDGDDNGAMGTSPAITIQNSLPVFDWTHFQIATGLDSLGSLWVNIEDEFTAGISDDDGDVPSLTCSGEGAYQVSNCIYNFTTLSNARPASCQNNPNTGCFNIPDNHGEYTVTLSADDGYDIVNQDVRFNISLRYLPPVVNANNITITEGQGTTCPCGGFDPDGGSVSLSCEGAPFNGSSTWTAFYEDIGIHDSYCVGTDDEGQQTIKNFTITVNSALYNTTLIARIDDNSQTNIRLEYDYLINLYGNPLQDQITRGLINDNNLAIYTSGSPTTSIGCWDAACINTLKMSTIQDYFNNFQANLTAQQRIDIHGNNWAQLMDNGGTGDVNEEIGLIRVWIQQI